MVYDICIVIFVLIFLIVGQKRGFVRSVYSLLSIVLSVVLVYLLKDIFIKAVAESPLGEAIGGFFAESLGSEFSEEISLAAVSVVSMVILYFASKFILRALVGILNAIAKLPILSSLNSFLGAVFGIVAAALWITVITNIANLFPEAQKLIAQSSLVEFFGILMK